MIINSNLRVELCARSGYTPKIGIGSISDLVKEAKEKNIGALCLADYYTTAGFYKFESECKKNDIIPLFGTTIFVDIDFITFDAVLIAKNRQGIIDLNKFLTNIDHNRFNIHDLPKISRNIIFILVVDKDVSNIISKIQMFDYFGITNGEDKIMHQLIENVPTSKIVELGGSNYINVVQKTLFDFQNFVVSNKYNGIKALNQFLYYDRAFYDKFVMDNPKDVLSSIENISVEENISYFHKPDELMSYDAFEKQVFDEARTKYMPLSLSIRKRITEELAYLKSNDSWIIISYFYKICSFLRSNKQSFYLRGNGSSSVVCYVLGISNIDPIKYNLHYQSLFNNDKFQPDIDICVSPNFFNSIITDLVDEMGSDSLVYAGQSIYYSESDIAKDILPQLGSFINENNKSMRNLLELKPFELTNTIKMKSKHDHGFVIKSKSDTFFSVTSLFNIFPDGLNTMDTDYREINNCFYKFDILEDELLDEVNINLDKCSKYNVDYLNIDWISSSPYFQNSFIKQIINKVKPKTFDEYAKVFAIASGVDVWSNNQDEFFEKCHDLSKIITTREDVIDYLVSCGVDFEEAFKISENIRKGLGKKCKFKPEYKIDEDMIKIFNKIKFLPSRSYILEKLRCIAIACFDNEAVVGE